MLIIAIQETTFQPRGTGFPIGWLLFCFGDSSTESLEIVRESCYNSIQELYTCLLWDADMRCENGEWHYYKFNGQTKWNEQVGDSESMQERRKYMLNAYHVLLTRARKGLIICVPEGNANKTVGGFWEDNTRIPEYYDGTYSYLKSLGLIEL